MAVVRTGDAESVIEQNGAAAEATTPLVEPSIAPPPRVPADLFHVPDHYSARAKRAEQAAVAQEVVPSSGRQPIADSTSRQHETATDAPVAVPTGGSQPTANVASQPDERVADAPVAVPTGDIKPPADTTPSAPTSPARARPRLQNVIIVLASVVGVSVAIGVHHHRQHAAAPIAQPKLAPVDPAPALPAPVVANQAPPPATDTSEPRHASEPASALAVPAASIAAPPAQAETTRVTLDVKPIDARVYYLGRDWPGPPFVFELEKGEHKAVEIVRFGFVTARVVLDDKRPTVKFGMLRQHYAPHN